MLLIPNALNPLLAHAYTERSSRAWIQHVYEEFWDA